VRNFLGQVFQPGDYVFRGARDGNSSSFKFGIVQKVTSNSIGVNWLYRPGSFLYDDPVTGKRIWLAGLASKTDSFGTVKDPSSLCIVDAAAAAGIVQYCDFWINEAQLARGGDAFALDRIVRHFK
jgi:hypothetical protein